MEESRLVMLTCAKGAMKAANIMPREARARPSLAPLALRAPCAARACALAAVLPRAPAPRREARRRRTAAAHRTAGACERGLRAAGGHPDHGEHVCAGAVAERDGGQLLWHALGRAALQPGRPGLHVGHHRGGARAAPAQGARCPPAARPRARAHARPVPARAAPGRPAHGGRGAPRRPPGSAQVGRAYMLARALRCQCQEPAQLLLLMETLFIPCGQHTQCLDTLLQHVGSKRAAPARSAARGAGCSEADAGWPRGAGGCGQGGAAAGAREHHQRHVPRQRQGASRRQRAVQARRQRGRAVHTARGPAFHAAQRGPMRTLESFRQYAAGRTCIRVTCADAHVPSAPVSGAVAAKRALAEPRRLTRQLSGPQEAGPPAGKVRAGVHGAHAAHVGRGPGLHPVRPARPPACRTAQAPAGRAGGRTSAC